MSPVLELPSAFQSAHVGEQFACTLAGNNELLAFDNSKAVSGVRISAEMQSPSNPNGQVLTFEDDTAVDAEVSPGPGESLQKIVRLDLKEEGNHILAVTVTYTENTLAAGEDGKQTSLGARVRTFRKLYQFVAQQLLSVRTKAGELPSKSDTGKYVLEAQLENLADGTVCLEVSTIGLFF